MNQVLMKQVQQKHNLRTFQQRPPNKMTHPALREGPGGTGALEHAAGMCLGGEARVQLFDRGVFDQPGAGRSREFCTSPVRAHSSGKPEGP